MMIRFALHQSLGHRVPVEEAGGQADIAALGPLLELGHGRLVRVFEGLEALLHGFLPEPQDRLLGVGECFRGFDPAVHAIAGDRAASQDQLATDGTLLDQLGVGLDPAQVRQVQIEPDEVRQAAGDLERPLLFHLPLQSPHIDRRVAGLKREHAREEILMPLEVKVLGRHAARDQRQQVRLEQNSSEHRALGFLAVR